jgi:hypothetical protein
MFDLSSLKEAKKKAESNYDKNAEDFEKEYQGGLSLLKEFAETTDNEKLKSSASKFFNAIRCKRSAIEPYIYLSYIFFLFDEDELSKKYLNYAKSLDSSHPQITKIQTLIYSN